MWVWVGELIVFFVLGLGLGWVDGDVDGDADTERSFAQECFHVCV